MHYNVYVTVSGEDRIARYAMDSDTGELETRGDVPLSGRPAPIAVSPDQQYMYVAQRESCEITGFRINASDGALTAIGTIPLESDPCYMATDRTGRYLFSAYYLAEKAAVHRIENGAVTHPPIEWRTTGRGSHCFQTDRSNRYAFVPHIDGNGAPNAIFQFRFDPSTGQLTPNDPPRFAEPAMTGPRHFCFHPTKEIIYVSNEQGCSVSVCALDTGTGTLSLLQTISTLPDSWAGESKCSQIRISPGGRFLYAPNRGHDSIAEFSVDPDSGLLTSLGHTAAEPVPRAFEIDPAGHFLLSAGLESGRLAVYQIDNESGRLERIATHEVGAKPMWVAILPVS
ncbi:MAG: beta-propeller fold lactonase family protein [Alphaproteobacteria bacterium]|nr:beta-propeller fold lactonase family protein [Alphaproteobacteria bacterium]